MGGDKFDNEHLDAEHGSHRYSASARNSNSSSITKGIDLNQEHPVRQIAGFWGYVFQIIFQMNAGAVILTDTVFWFIIVPFLAIKDYNLNFLIINMHSINAVFLIGDIAFNCLENPKISYSTIQYDRMTPRPPIRLVYSRRKRGAGPDAREGQTSFEAKEVDQATS